jgi:hypothetical protein
MMTSIARYRVHMEQLAPLILVDVDGVLNPSQHEADGYRSQWVFPNGVPHRLWLHPMHGQILSELAEAANADLVWASYWRDRADTKTGSRWARGSEPRLVRSARGLDGVRCLSLAMAAGL